MVNNSQHGFLDAFILNYFFLCSTWMTDLLFERYKKLFGNKLCKTVIPWDVLLYFCQVFAGIQNQISPNQTTFRLNNYDIQRNQGYAI